MYKYVHGDYDKLWSLLSGLLKWPECPWMKNGTTSGMYMIVLYRSLYLLLNIERTLVTLVFILQKLNFEKKEGGSLEKIHVLE